MIVRTPLIPGVTDSIENLKPIAEYIAKMDNIVRYELLNFNPLGESKCEALQKENSTASAKPLSEEKLNSLVSALSEVKGLEVKVI